MKSTPWMAVLTAVAASAGLATALRAADAPKLKEASIPFINHHSSIRDWNALDDKGVWIQGNSGRWYYATFFGPCTGIQFEQAVAFLPGPSGSLDRWGGLETRSTGRCQFLSLTASDKPPARLRKPAKAS